jgi:membrane protein DedA with SNARE-associated domain
MLSLLAKHSLSVILVAVFLEELGIPMPIPTDVLIVFGGIAAGRSPERLALWFVLLSIASAAGASGLYAIIRRGGRPLVDRYGRYAHLGPEQLARGEAMLRRTGWLGIAIGRAIPGLRYVTVIACGLLNIPYWKFVTAHIVGSSVYILTFLLLGATFGPAVIEWLHAPESILRLGWTLGLGIGLPVLFVWLARKTQKPAEPSRRRLVWSVLLASFAGATAMSALWASSTTISEVLGEPRPLNAPIALAGWLLGRGMRPGTAYTLIYTGILLACIVLATGYYELIQPRLAAGRWSMRHQIVDLTLLGALPLALVFMPPFFLRRAPPFAHWWAASGPWVIVVILAGIMAYAVTTAYGRSLAIAVLPSLRRRAPPAAVADNGAATPAVAVAGNGAAAPATAEEVE